LSWTSPGIDRGSEPGSRLCAAKAKSWATAGTAEISLRSCSSAARHSTWTADIAGVLNSSPLRAGPAWRKAKDASADATIRTAFLPTASLPPEPACRAGPNPWRARSMSRPRSGPQYVSLRKCVGERWFSRRSKAPPACRTTRRSGPWSPVRYPPLPASRAAAA